MATGPVHGKVTLLKLALGVGLLVVVGSTALALLNQKDQESVKALDTNPYSRSDTSDIGTVDVDSDSDRLSNCDDGQDCDDQDDRENRPAATGMSAPATNNSIESETQADFAIEEEGIPAVDEKPAKTN